MKSNKNHMIMLVCMLLMTTASSYARPEDKLPEEKEDLNGDALTSGKVAFCDRIKYVNPHPRVTHARSRGIISSVHYAPVAALPLVSP